MSVNFLQVGEELETRYLTDIGQESIYAYVGKSTGKLFGFKIFKGGETRTIWMHDIDRMKQILAEM
jgi:hypothetical protein